jgi:hypothetical protein
LHQKNSTPAKFFFPNRSDWEYSARASKAGLAQLVEQLICNQQVVGSSPTTGSINPANPIRVCGFFLMTPKRRKWAAVHTNRCNFADYNGLDIAAHLQTIRLFDIEIWSHSTSNSILIAR